MHFENAAPTASIQPRIVGIDIARGLAILGMMGVHILNPGPFPWASWIPGDWDRAMAGRSAILFAVIAGISIAFLSGRTQPVTGIALVQSRMRILIRAVVIFAVGGFLNAMHTNVAVILEYYAVLFVLALPFLSLRPRELFMLSGALALVMPPLYFILLNLAHRQELGNWSMFKELLITGRYPAMIWVIFVLLGLAVGRLEMTSRPVQVRLFAAGVSMMAIGYTGGQLVKRLLPPEPRALDELPGRFDLSRMATMEPHSGTTFEVVGSSGVALAIIAACLLIAPWMRITLFPLAAAGSMAFSVYIFHVISMVWISPTIENQYQIYLVTVAITLALTSLLAILVGKGPIERFLTSVSHRAAGAER